jgi:subfamily B ATP-binding cassette protein MsbA
VLRNPDILILDEATSALDTENERLVQSAMNNMLEGRTALIIAHRLSTIVNADKIVVLDNGKIVEQGTHTQLYANTTGVYHKLCTMQQFAK